MLLTVADNIITYCVTPDLTREANPLASVFGFGWSGLIVSNIINSVVYVLSAYYTFARFRRSSIQCKGLKQFLSMLCYSRPDKFYWIFFRFPKNKIFYSYFFASIGYLVSVVFIFIRLIAVVEWICVLTISNYSIYLLHRMFNLLYHGTTLVRFGVFAGLVFSGLLIVGFWVKKEYIINRKILESICLSTDRQSDTKRLVP
jgi:hypothetical protein